MYNEKNIYFIIINYFEKYIIEISYTFEKLNNNFK